MTKSRSRNRNKNNQGVAVRVILALVLSLLVLGALGTGAAIGIGVLRDVWLEQCRVTDRELDVVITTGKMVHPDVVTLHFGLTNGANLASIPFTERRANLLERIPNIRDIHIERRQPNRVTVDIVEREPLVRVVSTSTPKETGRVADTDGVVFRFSSGTSMLPLVREHANPPTAPGKRLTGNAAAALRLVEVASQPELSALRIIEIDTSKPDYLLVTLGNYDRAEIAWDHMLEDSRLARESLRRQLKHLSSTIATHLTPNTTLWIATDWGPGGRIYASQPTTPAEND